MVDPRGISHEDGRVCIDFAENFEGFEKGARIEKDPEDPEEEEERERGETDERRTKWASLKAPKNVREILGFERNEAGKVKEVIGKENLLRRMIAKKVASDGLEMKSNLEKIPFLWSWKRNSPLPQPHSNNFFHKDREKEKDRKQRFGGGI